MPQIIIFTNLNENVLLKTSLGKLKAIKETA
jgi:hypothetical protein